MTERKPVAGGHAPRPKLRELVRSYLLAGRIAAGIFQNEPVGRLPEVFAISRVQRPNSRGRQAVERIGNVIITLPWQAKPTAASPQDRCCNGGVSEDPLRLPELYRRR